MSTARMLLSISSLESCQIKDQNSGLSRSGLKLWAVSLLVGQDKKGFFNFHELRSIVVACYQANVELQEIFGRYEWLPGMGSREVPPLTCLSQRINELKNVEKPSLPPDNIAAKKVGEHKELYVAIRGVYNEICEEEKKVDGALTELSAYLNHLLPLVDIVGDYLAVRETCDYLTERKARENKTSKVPSKISWGIFGLFHEIRQGYELCVKGVPLLPLAKSLCNEMVISLK